MTMLQNVNPLEKSDPAEIARVTQGLVDCYKSSEESGTLKNIEKILGEQNFLQAASFVDKKGHFTADQFSWGDGSTDAVFYDTPPDLQKVTIDLYRDGVKVLSLPGVPEEGRHSLEDLLADLQPGAYRIHAWGMNSQGEEVKIPSLISGRIQSIQRDLSGFIQAFIGKQDFSMDQLQGIENLTVPAV